MDIKLTFLDDDKEILDMTKAEMTKLGYIGSYFNEIEKFEKSLDGMPLIIVLDYYLGGRTGVDVMRKVKDYHPISTFIIVSSKMSTTQLTEIINVGWGCYYINRDTSNNDFDDFIKELCNKIDTARASLNAKLKGMQEAQKKHEAIKMEGLEILKIIDS